MEVTAVKVEGFSHKISWPYMFCFLFCLMVLTLKNRERKFTFSFFFDNFSKHYV